MNLVESEVLGMTAIDKQRRKMAVENMYKMYLKYYPAMKEDIKAYIEDK